jgi:sporulation protein YlmC with PRC-barrel domain
MKATAGFPAALWIFLAVATAHAQGTNPPPAAGADSPAPPLARTVDDPTLARSARASKLIGSHVYASDANVGRIEDILIDPERAAVTAAIVSVGGFLGLGEKLIAIPLARIKVGAEARFTINMSPEELRNAPAFDFAKLK